MEQQSLKNTNEQETTKLDENAETLEKDTAIQNEKKPQEEVATEEPKQSEQISSDELEKQEDMAEYEQNPQEDQTPEENQEVAIETTDEAKDETTDEDEQEKIEDKQQRIINHLIFIIAMLTILIVMIISFKMGNIGFNAFTAWDVDKIELTKENLQILNDTKLNIFGDAKNERRIYCSKFKWFI